MLFKKKLKSNISGKLYLEKNPLKIKEINYLRQKLLDDDYDLKDEYLSSFIFQNKKNAKRILKMLLKNIFFSENIRISDSCLKQMNTSYSQRHKVKFFLPLCMQQIQNIKKNTKLDIDLFKSRLFFIFLILRNYFKGIFLGIYILFSNLILRLININYKDLKNDFIYFDLKIPEHDLKYINRNNNFLIINQIIKKLRLKKKFNIVLRNDKKIYFNNFTKTNFFLGENPIYYGNKPYSNIDTFRKLIQFFYWFLFSSFICLKDLIFLKWYNAYLFTEAIKSKLFDLCNINLVPKIYLISYQGTLSRSLWTLDHNKKVKRSYLYFYSTNGDGYISKYSDTKNLSHWSELEYDHYLTWDKYQKLTLKNNLKIENSKVNVVGPMLNFIGQDLKDNIKNYILIFDVVPLRISFELTNTFTILKAKYLNKFTNDIIKICNEKNINVVHKIKKNINNKIFSKNYINNLNNNNNNKNYFIVDKNCSIENLILNSRGVISFPYTSTAIMASVLKKPSIYYDPSKLIDSNNKIFSHGIEVLNDVDSLKNWLSSINH